LGEGKLALSLYQRNSVRKPPKLELLSENGATFRNKSLMGVIPNYSPC